MAKAKLSTPKWIIEGYDSPKDYAKAQGKPSVKKKEKTFKIRECPKCGSDDVGVVISGVEGKGKEWECRKCKWKGKDIKEKELTEEEFMKYLDEKGEAVA